MGSIGKDRREDGYALDWRPGPRRGASEQGLELGRTRGDSAVASAFYTDGSSSRQIRIARLADFALGDAPEWRGSGGVISYHTAAGQSDSSTWNVTLKSEYTQVALYGGSRLTSTNDRWPVRYWRDVPRGTKLFPFWNVPVHDRLRLSHRTNPAHFRRQRAWHFCYGVSRGTCGPPFGGLKPHVPRGTR